MVSLQLPLNLRYFMLFQDGIHNGIILIQALPLHCKLILIYYRSHKNGNRSRLPAVFSRNEKRMTTSRIFLNFYFIFYFFCANWCGKFFHSMTTDETILFGKPCWDCITLSFWKPSNYGDCKNEKQVMEQRINANRKDLHIQKSHVWV